MSLFEVSDYRSWFKIWLKSRPKQGHGELSKIASYLGVNSTLISQVLSGSRDFSLEQGHGLCEFFSFNAVETRYFMALLQVERAATQGLKKYFQKEVADLKKQAGQVISRLEVDTELNDGDKSVLVGNWKATAILVTTGIEGGVTIEEVRTTLNISASSAKETLLQLVKMGLVEQKAGRFHTGFKRLHIPKGSSFLLRHYTNWRLRAIDRSDHIADDEIMYTSVSSISEADIPVLKEKILSWISQYSKKVSDSPAERAVCLNFDFFRV